MSIQEKAEELVNELPDDLEVEVSEVENSLNKLVNEFTVPLEEAMRSTRNKYMDSYDGDTQYDSPDSQEEVNTYDIDDLSVEQDEKWFNIQGTVQQLFELSEKQASWISQRGVIGDDSGTVIFTIPQRAVESNPDLKLNNGDTYKLESVVGDAYNDEIGINITENTTAETLEKKFTPPQGGTDNSFNINDLSVEQDEEWFSMQGTVQRLFELSERESSWISQRGVIGDDTGTTIFTIPQRAVDENPDLTFEEGDTYKFDSVVGDAYQGTISVNATTYTTVEKLDNEFTPPENDTHVTGAIVDIQEVSGLIKRCPEEECTQVLQNGTCAEHGDVDGGEFDLRLKTVMDDGKEPHQVFFGKEATEAITGITLEEAKQIAKDELDKTAVVEKMKPLLLGSYYTIAGNTVGEYVLVNKFERVDRDWEDEARTLLGSNTDADTEVEA